LHLQSFANIACVCATLQQMSVCNGVVQKLVFHPMDLPSAPEQASRLSGVPTDALARVLPFLSVMDMLACRLVHRRFSAALATRTAEEVLGVWFECLQPAPVEMEEEEDDAAVSPSQKGHWRSGVDVLEADLSRLIPPCFPQRPNAFNRRHALYRSANFANDDPCFYDQVFLFRLFTVLDVPLTPPVHLRTWLKHLMRRADGRPLPALCLRRSAHPLADIVLRSMNRLNSGSAQTSHGAAIAPVRGDRHHRHQLRHQRQSTRRSDSVSPPPSPPPPPLFGDDVHVISGVEARRLWLDALAYRTSSRLAWKMLAVEYVTHEAVIFHTTANVTEAISGFCSFGGLLIDRRPGGG
jgi:hypothetical protein